MIKKFSTIEDAEMFAYHAPESVRIIHSEAQNKFYVVDFGFQPTALGSSERLIANVLCPKKAIQSEH